MPDTIAEISAKQAGYLRQIPAADATATDQLDTATRRMANKLVRWGLVEVSQIHSRDASYKRTPDGERALDAFDESIENRYSDLLLALQQGEQVNGDRCGIPTLVDAGIIHVRDDRDKLELELTEGGRQLVDQITTTISATPRL